MEVRIHLRHISHSHEFSDQLKHWLTERLERLQGYGQLTLDLYVVKSAGRTETHGALFEFHIEAQAPWLPKKLFAKSDNFDFWTGIYKCTSSLKKQMLKSRGRRRNRIRHQTLPNLFAS